MGFCRSDDEFTLMLAAFQAQRDAMLALHRDFELLEPQTAKRAVDDLSDFYAFADEPGAARRLQQECQQLR